jgi:hypothetical protein
MSQNNTQLPRRIAQPPLPKHEREVIGYLAKQRETIDRMWDLLVLVISGNHGAGTLATRPPAAIKNRTYLVTDTVPQRISFDDGAAWHDINLP